MLINIIIFSGILIFRNIIINLRFDSLAGTIDMTCGVIVICSDDGITLNNDTTCSTRFQTIRHSY